MRIRALFLDVDGVLTDGQIYLDGRGHELKVFNTKDGHGMRKAAAAGITLCWISGRTSPATARRAKELGVPYCYQGVQDKGARLESMRRRLKLQRSEMASIGDDEPDIPMFEATGLSACPADAVPAARRAATVVLESTGGHGAVRELIELILKRNARAASSPPASPASGTATRPGSRAGTGGSSARQRRTASRRRPRA